MKIESFPGFLKDNYLIILIFIVAAIPRFFGLEREGIWYDEAVSISVSKLGFADIFKWVFNNTAETNPPFYYMILHCWIPEFGDSEFVSRIPSAFFGSLSIFAIYAVGKLLSDKKTGLIAALILATSVLHISFAQEARGYTLMVCLILASYYSLLQLTIKRRTLYTITYIVSTVLLVYTHYYGVMIVLAQNIFCFTLLLKNKKIGVLGIGWWLKLQVITGLFLLPGLFSLAVIALKIQKGFWVPEQSTEDVWQYFNKYAGSIYLLVLFLAFTLYSVAGLRKVKYRRENKKSGKPAIELADTVRISEGGRLYMLLLWMVVPILVPFLISLVSSPILIARYTIGASLAFYLLASKGIGNMNKLWLSLAVAGLIVVFSCFNITGYYKSVGRHQWRELMSYIESNAQSGDVIVVSPIYESVTAEYYNKRKDLRIIPLGRKFPSFEGLGDRNIWFVFHAHPESRENARKGLGGKYYITEKHYYRLDLFQLREKGN
ncbi:MAG: glycosyltransferase family 39 protein [Thermodesulfobacteriota bacterium]